MKRIMVFLTVLAVVATLFAGCAQSDAPSLTPDQTTPETTPTPGLTTPGATPAPGPTAQPSSPGASTGTLTVLVTDAPKHEVVNVVVHFLKVEVHKSADGQGGGGEWIEIPLADPDGQTFDNSRQITLSPTMGNVTLAQQDQVETGNKYTQIRVYLDEGEGKGVTVTYIPDPEDLYENDEPKTKTVEAKLPSGKLRFVRPFEVVENGETKILLDFDLQKSVVFTGASKSDEVKVIVKPVVKLLVSGKEKPIELEYSLGTTDGATAELSTDQAHSGKDSVHLETISTEGDGDEARIVITPPAGTTLGDIESISWWEYLQAGYPPHLDILLDVDNDGTYEGYPDDDILVFEYAYNSLDHYNLEAPMPYGAVTGGWYETFNDDGRGPSQIDDLANAWAGSGPPGPPGDSNFIFHTLEQWKDGVTYTTDAEKTIDTDTPVVAFEIEVDNWIVQTNACVDDIEIVIDGVTYTVSF